MQTTSSAHQMTIEQLAHRSGMSVRNIRAHPVRGLLAPPEVRTRVGYYGPDHLAQLNVIQDLQAESFNLAAIKGLHVERAFREIARRISSPGQ